jgi:FAD/FMN-containing dehydrogenase
VDDNITDITALEFNVQRSSIDVIHSLETLLSKDQVSTEASILESYGQDWTRFTQPAPLAIVFPRSTNEVADIVKCARDHKFALVPSGGRTGLSGGAVAANGEVVGLSRQTEHH